MLPLALPRDCVQPRIASEICPATTHQRDGKDQDDDDEVQTHQDVIQATDSTVQVAHGMLDRELLAVDFHARHLDFVTADVAIPILVEDREGCICFFRCREEPRDVLNEQFVTARADERVKQAAGEL